MKIICDLHTHTIASGHYTTDTLTMIARAAKDKGLEYLGVTDHTKGIPNAAKDDYFINLKTLSPKKLFGVNMLYGAEVNIADEFGHVDLSEDILKKLDYAIASLHEEVFLPHCESANTNAILNAMDNKYVNIIGHPENGAYPVNFSLICEKAKDTDTIIELNTESIRKDSYRGDQSLLAKALMRECKKYDCYVSLGSDSHGQKRIGDLNDGVLLLEEIGVNPNKVVNTNIDLFKRIIDKKRIK